MLDAEQLQVAITASAAEVRECAGTAPFKLLLAHLELLRQAKLVMDLASCKPEETAAHQAQFEQLAAIGRMISADGGDDGRA